MNCCADCIGDRELGKLIFPRLTTARKKCDYCKNENKVTVNPVDLRDEFEILISAYNEDDTGKLLAEWLKEDWLMFPEMDTAHAKDLLGEILDDGEIIRLKFTPLSDNDDNALSKWQKLRDELKYENRFFHNNHLDLNRLEEALSHIYITSDEIPEIWYRARIQETENIFKITEMGAPPKELASHGRANPVGIPYLYIASDKETAASEIRPHTGELINIASFTIKEDLNFVDLRNPRKLASPLSLSDEKKVRSMRTDISFLEVLGNELMMPVIPKAAAINYIPSQYLCEFMKNRGYKGVIYNSSVGEGINLALFDPENAIANDQITTHNVTKVTVNTETI